MAFEARGRWDKAPVGSEGNEPAKVTAAGSSTVDWLGLGRGIRDRTRLAVLALLLALAGIAWLVTAVRMQGMESGPGMYPEELGFYLSAWVVMMAAMMFPSVWPTVGLYAGMQRGRREHLRCRSTHRSSAAGPEHRARQHQPRSTNSTNCRAGV